MGKRTFKINHETKTKNLSYQKCSASGFPSSLFIKSGYSYTYSNPPIPIAFKLRIKSEILLIFSPKMFHETSIYPPLLQLSLTLLDVNRKICRRKS